MVILLLLHALYDLFTSTQLQTGLARCLTTFATVSTLQNCNFTSLFPETFCSGRTVPAACLPRLLSHTWIALACIRIRFSTGNTTGVGVFMSVVAKNAKNYKRDGEGRRRLELNHGTGGVGNCYNHCRDVLDFGTLTHTEYRMLAREVDSFLNIQLLWISHNRTSSANRLYT